MPPTSTLLRLLDLAPGAGDTVIAPGYGPAGKRAFGGQFLAQTLAAAARSVDGDKRPTSLHLQFLRGGAGGADVEYDVERLYDGRTAATRRVLSRQDDRVITAATVSFSAPLAGPEHGRHDLRHEPDLLDPALRVHGHSMSDRSHRSGTTDASVWFHRPIRTGSWNLLESRSPAAADGRGVITASLVGDDGMITATLVQEGLIAARD